MLRIKIPVLSLSGSSQCVVEKAAYAGFSRLYYAACSPHVRRVVISAFYPFNPLILLGLFPFQEGFDNKSFYHA